MPEVLLADAGRDQLAHLDDYAAIVPNWYGASGSGPDEFRAPRAVVRAAGGFLIADTGNHRIVSIDDPSGSGWRSFGAFGSGMGQFVEPTGIALDSNSRIYIADAGNGRVVRIDDLDGSGWVSYGARGTPTPTDPAVGKFRKLAGLAVDGADGLWIADWECSRVVRITSMAGAGWATFAAAAPVALAADDVRAAILVGALGAKRIGRHAAASGALAAATPAGALAVPAAVQLHDGTIVALDAASRRLVTIDDTLGHVTTQVHLADLDLRRPMGMVVW